MVGAQPFQRDKKDARTKIRQAAARDRSVDAWAGKLEEALNSELTEENYFEASSSIKQLASNKFLMERFTREVTKIFEQTPDIRNAMKAIIERKVAIANKMLPRQIPGTAFSDPIPPSSFRLQEFGRVLQVLNNPKDTILTAMLSGTLTPEMVKVFAEAWPKLYEEVSTAAIESITKEGVRKNLTQTQKMVLATLTGSQMMDASVALKLAETFAPKEKEGKGPSRAPRNGGMDDSVSALSAGTTVDILAR